ncbi:MAG: hypothetical protein ABFD60_04190 [Bryobacteraceae bacterium]
MRSLALRSQIELILQRCRGDAALAALVGTLPDGTLRVFLDYAPEKVAMPFVYFVVPASNERKQQEYAFQRDSVFNFIIVSSGEHRFDIEQRLSELFDLWSANLSGMAHHFKVAGSQPMSTVDEGARLNQLVLTVQCSTSIGQP